MKMLHVYTFNGFVQPVRMLEIQAILFASFSKINNFQGYPGVN